MIGNVMRNYSTLTLIRVVSRIGEFFFKAYLIRTVLSENIFGHTLNLDFILNTSLHVIRVCLKPSYQKGQNKDIVKAIKSGMNIMTFGVLTAFLLAVLAASLQLGHSGGLKYFRQSVFLYIAAAVMEGIFEKYNVQNILRYSYLKIALTELVSLIPKTLFILSAAYFGLFETFGILVIAMGHFIYICLLTLIAFLTASQKSLLLQPYAEDGVQIYIDPNSKQSLYEFSWLTILKVILHEFEKIVLVVLDIAKNSSVYSLISGLGSIVVRYVYAPLDQIFYNYFSRGEETQSVNALISFVNSLLLFSLLAMSYGYNYSQSFLLVLYGERWASEQAISAMRTYTMLLAIMGMNGGMEAFTFARGKQSIAKYKYYSIVTTAIYVMSCLLFVNIGYGVTGLFLGNIIGMALRICLTWTLEIKNHIQLWAFWLRVKPPTGYAILTIFLFVLGHKEMNLLHRKSMGPVLTFLIGGALFVVNLLPIAYDNRHTILKMVRDRIAKEKSV